MTIATIKIHPAIGIARVGNSPAEFFIGPEIPGDRSIPDGGYKDDKCMVKRQAAKFHIFAYHKDGSTNEITSEQADIRWSVHLANKKASVNNRNSGPSNDLIIDSGIKTLSGPNQSQILDEGKIKFPSKPSINVPLGEIRTDEMCHLLVLGGSGNSDSPFAHPISITSFYNNAGWYDDVSDGPVNATIKFHDTGREFKADGAWVIIAPPKFAPGLDNIVTLYDRLVDMGAAKGWTKPPSTVSYIKHVYPILERARHIKWVYNPIGAHTWSHPVIDPIVRNNIFVRLTAPSDDTTDMPKLFESDIKDGRLTKSQYEIMKNWSEGSFVNDWTGTPSYASVITAEGLDQAALENAVGGAFYPGIEVGGISHRPILRPENYKSLFRLNHKKLQAGDLTAYMALPWQADFKACSFGSYGVVEGTWWPVPRPNLVIPKGEFNYKSWDRDVPSSEEMVKNWHTLGFVVREGDEYLEVDKCSIPSITPLTPHLDFMDVPRGPMNISGSRALSIEFEVKSITIPVTIRVESRPKHARLRPSNLSATIEPTQDNQIAIARLWIAYETGEDGEKLNDEMIIGNSANSDKWHVTISANTVGRNRAAIGLVLDHSIKMSQSRGDNESKIKSLQDASKVFVDAMLEDDGLAIVHFGNNAKLLQGITKLGSPIDRLHTARKDAKYLLSASDLITSNGKSLTKGISAGLNALHSVESHYDTRSLLVLDGGDTTHEKLITDVEPQVNERIYAIRLGTANNANFHSLQNITTNHGGYTLVTGGITSGKDFILEKYFLQILGHINNYQIVKTVQGELISGREYRIPFYVTEDDLGMEVILLTRFSHPMSFRLQTPNGFIIEPRSSNSNVHYIESMGHNYYTIVLPVELEHRRFDKGGTWNTILATQEVGEIKTNSKVYVPKASTLSKMRKRFEHDKDNVLLENVVIPYCLLIYSYSGLTFRARVRQTSYEPGAPVYIDANVSETGSISVRGTHVRAEVTRPDGSTSLVLLQEREDSHFSGYFNSAAPGVYRINVKANGRSSLGCPFQREQILSAAIYL